MQQISFFAHSTNANGQGVPEALRDHLQRVAQRAGTFALAFDAEEQARLAGLLHDLGKYADKFQKYLAGSVSRAGDHWSVGSLYALVHAAQRGNAKLGLAPAMAIAAHHGFLEYLQINAPQFVSTLCQRLSNSEIVTDCDYKSLMKSFIDDGLTLPEISNGILVHGRHPISEMLDVRMLFSALVDADYLETEAHFEGDLHQPRRPRPDGPPLDYCQAIDAFERYIGSLKNQYHNDPLTALREELQDTCRKKANGPQGIYTLSAPTGLGKTLAMLAFALYHAKQHNLRRIILVMPYINIIDQTASIYREIFSPRRGFPDIFVLEDHSLARNYSEKDQQEPDGEQRLERLLTENWDAPVILTTNVQFFESLFSHRPSSCRKLHRIARSVILFDEVQTIPTHLGVPTLAAISALTDPNGRYGVTTVFATATQPAFTVLHDRVKKYSPAGWQPQELVPNVNSLFEATAHRVTVEWRDQQPIAWDDLADKLVVHSQVLCIVNLKRHAVTLFRRLAERVSSEPASSLFHLSTSLCPIHRRQVLAEVNRRLHVGEPVRLIATQCVEAGVDLDFPVVYRALGPLEAIAQAAGRCNRHGKRNSGRLVIFMPLDEQALYPPGYEQAASATESFLKQLRYWQPEKLENLVSNPSSMTEYYKLFYIEHGYADGSAQLKAEKTLIDAIEAGDFTEVARRYRLIEENTVSVLVPYQPEEYQSLLQELNSHKGKVGFLRDWIRRACAHSVNIFRPKTQSPIWNYLMPIKFFFSRNTDFDADGWYTPTANAQYDQQLGLVFPETDQVFIV